MAKFPLSLVQSDELQASLDQAGKDTIILSCIIFRAVSGLSNM